MTEVEVKKKIQNIPVGSKLQLIKYNGEILDVVLASHETAAVEEKDYGSLVVPYLPPAILVQGRRWGVHRIEVSELINIALVGN